MILRVGWSATLCGLIAACLLVVTPSGQDATDFKELYAQAEYERALSLLASPLTSEAYQYRALCLLALGRSEEAEAAVTRLVTDFPTYVPATDNAPPRLVEMVFAKRRELLPGIARKTFAEGREHFIQKENDSAIERFQLVLTLTGDEAFEDRSTAQDLNTLAQGFIDLARATTVAPRAEVVPAAPPADRTDTAAPPAAQPQVAAPPSARPEPAAQAAPPPREVTQPIAQFQPVPPVPRDLISLVTRPLVLLVEIDSSGNVTNVEVQESAHPRYDRMVALAAREWRYLPATLGGVAVQSQQTISIQPER